MAALAQADAHRQGDYDGRGNLSDRSLSQFCQFFLQTCLDQIDFMERLLALDGLLERIRGYVEMRRAKLLPPPPNTSDRGLKLEAAHMLEETLLRGEVSRGGLIRVSGLPERTARDILKQLLDEGLLNSDSPKGVVRLAIPTHVATHLFPDLYPARLP